MYVHEDKGWYYLAEGRDPIERIAAYGKEPPTFTYPPTFAKDSVRIT